MPPGPDRTVSDGGAGGRAFPGQTRVVELENLSVGDTFEITVGEGGGGGGGGEGCEQGGTGAKGPGGSALSIPIFEEREDAQ